MENREGIFENKTKSNQKIIYFCGDFPLQKTDDCKIAIYIRETGNIFGTQQSGTPINFRIANLLTDGKILVEARKKANEILDDDPMLQKLEHKNLSLRVQKEIKTSWGNVS